MALGGLVLATMGGGLVEKDVLQVCALLREMGAEGRVSNLGNVKEIIVRLARCNMTVWVSKS